MNRSIQSTMTATMRGQEWLRPRGLWRGWGQMRRVWALRCGRGAAAGRR